MNENAQGKSVLLAGATGLVGGECLDLLLADPTFPRVTALVRRPLPPRTGLERLVVEVVDFNQLDRRPDLFAVNQIVCALGTTLRQAGSQSAFRRVDYDYTVQLAKLGLARGADHFLLVSSLGADSTSRVFYSRVKGEIEDAITGMGYRALTIVRPSWLLGDRAQRRVGETVAKRLGFLAPAWLRPVRARQVAEALVRASQEDSPGRRIIDNRDLQRMPV